MTWGGVGVIIGLMNKESGHASGLEGLVGQEKKIIRPTYDGLVRSFLASLALIVPMGLSKSQPIVGRDIVSPAVEAFTGAIRQDFQNEWGGLTPEEVEAREACLSGFSCAAWEQLNLEASRH